MNPFGRSQHDADKVLAVGYSSLFDKTYLIKVKPIKQRLLQ